MIQYKPFQLPPGGRMNQERMGQIALALLFRKLREEVYGENLTVGLRQRFERLRPEGVSETEFQQFLTELAAQMWAAEPVSK